jgi:CRISPR/Cas system-associated exonuclease Cas4 (RecB family)
METRKIETRLLGPIERHLLTRPLDTSRRQDVLHPSELVKDDFCPRAAYFRLIGKVLPPDRPNLRLQSIFDVGHSVHSKWQNYLQEMGVLYGVWETTRGPAAWDISSDLPAGARYKEVPLHDDGLRISGHSDGWVKGLGEDFLIEIKSIGPGTIRFENPALFRSGDLFAAWKEIRRPFPTHMRQGQLYLALAQRMAERGELESAPDEIVFLYELKADQSVKEFVVTYDPILSKDALDDAYDITKAAEMGVAPDCRSGGCKSCSVYEEEA